MRTPVSLPAESAPAEAGKMDAGTLLGVIYVVIRVAMLIGLFYFVVIEVLREKHKK